MIITYFYNTLHYFYTSQLVEGLIKCDAEVNAQINLEETPLFLSVEYTALFETDLCNRHLVDWC